jgi:hypothetical protein
MVSTKIKHAPSTESSIRCTVQIEGGAKSEEWETGSGGAKSAAMSMARVGFQSNKTVTLPSVASSAPVTCTRHMVLDMDVWDLQAQLLELVGFGKVTIWLTPMNALGADDYAKVAGTQSLVYEGLLSDVVPVSSSNESTSPAGISITVTGGTWRPAA